MKFLLVLWVLAAVAANADRLDDIVQTMADEHLRCFYATLPLWKSTVIAMERRDFGQIFANFDSARQQRCNFITDTPDGFMSLMDYPADTDHEMLWEMVKLMQKPSVETLPLSFNSTEFHLAIKGRIAADAVQEFNQYLDHLHDEIRSFELQTQEQERAVLAELERIEADIRKDNEERMKVQEDARKMFKQAHMMIRERSKNMAILGMPLFGAVSEPCTDPRPISPEFDWTTPMTPVEEKGEPCHDSGSCVREFWSVRDLMSQIEKGGTIETVVEEKQNQNGDVVERHVTQYLNLNGNRVQLYKSQTEFVNTTDRQLETLNENEIFI